MPKKIPKIILLGAPSSGKSALVDRYLNDRFDESHTSFYGPVEPYLKRSSVASEDCPILIDTSSTESFRTIISSYSSVSNVVFIVLDSTKINTFSQLEKQVDDWLELIGNAVLERQFSFVMPSIGLIGSKIDLLQLPEKTARFSLLKEISKKKGLMLGPFMVSARSGENIREPFNVSCKAYQDADFSFFQEVPGQHFLRAKFFLFDYLLKEKGRLELEDNLSPEIDLIFSMFSQLNNASPEEPLEKILDQVELFSKRHGKSSGCRFYPVLRYSESHERFCDARRKISDKSHMLDEDYLEMMREKIVSLLRDVRTQSVDLVSPYTASF